jgi:hypothetical protein
MKKKRRRLTETVGNRTTADTLLRGDEPLEQEGGLVALSAVEGFYDQFIHRDNTRLQQKY